MYLLLHRCEDEPSCHLYPTKELALKAIAELPGIEFRSIAFGISNPREAQINLEEFPARTAYLFEAKSITPKPKTVVTEYDL